jgi:hypothetical protein
MLVRAERAADMPVAVCSRTSFEDQWYLNPLVKRTRFEVPGDVE